MTIGDAAVIDVRPLLPGEREALVHLLADLSPEEWQAPTACPGWTVKAVALHILEDDFGWLSRGRDGDHTALLDDTIDYREFVAQLDAKNQRWVDGAAGLSPRVIIDLLVWSGAQVDEYLTSLDVGAASRVIWAGPDAAPLWFGLAREFTERWVHQQQIRDAVGRPGLLDDEHLGPVLRTFLWALPHHYRDIDAAPGTTLVVWITGPGGGAWSLARQGEGWDLTEEEPDRRDAEVALSSDTAWRLLTGVLVPDAAVELRGDLAIAEPFVSARSIIL